jgi:hypothetical protein
VEPLEPVPLQGLWVPRSPVHQDDGLVGARLQYPLQEDQGVDVRPIVGRVHGEELPSVGVYGGLDEDLPPTDLQLGLVYCNDLPLPPRDDGDHTLQGVDPSVDRDVTSLYHPGLVRHPSVGESSKIEQTGKYLAPDWSFIPPEDVGILAGLRQHVVWSHIRTMCPEDRSFMIAR